MLGKGTFGQGLAVKSDGQPQTCVKIVTFDVDNSSSDKVEKTIFSEASYLHLKSAEVKAI